MPKLLRKFFLFFLLSGILYSLSFFSSFLNKSLLPSPSFHFLSTLVDRFDKKIDDLNLNSLKLNQSKNVDAEEVLRPSTGEDQGESVDYPKFDKSLSPDYSNTYFFYLLRILLRFLFLVVVQLYVFYILIFRYGELFRDLCDLSLKSLKEFNWRSPMNFAKSLYCFLSWLTTIFLYYNSMLSVKFRVFTYSCVILLVSLGLFRAGFGRRWFLVTYPMILGITIYVSVLLTFSSRFVFYLGVFENWFVPLWSLGIVLLVLKVSRIDKVNFENYNTSLLSHQASCTLDLNMLFILLKMIKSTPFLGRLFVYNVYLSHLSFFFTICMVIHSLVVYISGIRNLTESPLFWLRDVVSHSLNTLFFYIFGIESFFSKNSRARVDGLLSEKLGRLKKLLSLVFGKFFDNFSENRSFTFVLKSLKTIPQLLLLILPPFFSRLYFDYSTVIVPTSLFLSSTNEFKDKLYLMALFTLSDLLRNLHGMLSWFTFRTSLRVILICTLNYSLSLFKLAI